MHSTSPIVLAKAMQCGYAAQVSSSDLPWPHLASLLSSLAGKAAQQSALGNMQSCKPLPNYHEASAAQVTNQELVGVCIAGQAEWHVVLQAFAKLP